MPDFYYDPDDQTFYDEDGDPVEIELSDEEMEAAIQQRFAQFQANEDARLEHIAAHAEAAEATLGRRLTDKELVRFAEDLAGNDWEGWDIASDSDYASLDSDEGRRQYMADRLTDGQETAEPYSSLDSSPETGGDAWAETGGDE
jgi:hypothetical protein